MGSSKLALIIVVSIVCLALVAYDLAQSKLCFAPARVKVKHYDYDPIRTWGK